MWMLAFPVKRMLALLIDYFDKDFIGTKTLVYEWCLAVSE